MRPNPFEIKELKRMDLRLRAYKESQWQKNFGFNPLLAAAWTCIVGAMFAIAILYITSIVVK